MDKVFERVAKLVAIFGTIAVVEGVLYDAFFFRGAEIDSLSFLSISDHLSTTAAHLPLLLLAFSVGLATAKVLPARIITDAAIRAATAKNAIRVATALVAVGMISNTLGWQMIAGLAFVTAVFVGAPAAAARYRLPENQVDIRILIQPGVMMIVLTAIFCQVGCSDGAIIRARSSATHRLSGENDKQWDGALVGVYDRGAIFLTKPANEVIIVSQRAPLYVEEIGRQQRVPIGNQLVHWVVSLFTGSAPTKSGSSGGL